MGALSGVLMHPQPENYTGIILKRDGQATWASLRGNPHVFSVATCPLKYPQVALWSLFSKYPHRVAGVTLHDEAQSLAGQYHQVAFGPAIGYRQLAEHGKHFYRR